MISSRGCGSRSHREAAWCDVSSVVMNLGIVHPIGDQHEVGLFVHDLADHVHAVFHAGPADGEIFEGHLQPCAAGSHRPARGKAASTAEHRMIAEALQPAEMLSPMMQIFKGEPRTPTSCRCRREAGRVGSAHESLPCGTMFSAGLRPQLDKKAGKKSSTTRLGPPLALCESCWCSAPTFG